jgi:periplasmic protein TonB
MRRDLIIGLLVSILVHGGVVGVSEWMKKGPPKPKPKDKDELVAIVMPPLPPDEPDKVEADDTPAPVIDFAPPMQTDVPQLVQPDSFVQQLQPPPPEGLKPNSGVINIPSGRVGAGGKGLGEIFDLNKLDQIPSPTYQSKPIYPFEMRRAGITGQVVVGFIVDSTGAVQNAYAVSSTQREFEAAAIQAVSKWKFNPGRTGGRSVNTRMQVPIVFSISDDN